jgi:hypothetical protein
MSRPASAEMAPEPPRLVPRSRDRYLHPRPAHYNARLLRRPYAAPIV